MNTTKIEWCDYTLNPIVGCPHKCNFCYARKQAKRQQHRCDLCYQFVPHAHLERLNHLKPTQKPARIFMDSMADWNGQGVEDEWIIKIIEKMKGCSQHTFQILSKRPDGYIKFGYPKNAWIGTSISTTGDCHRVHTLANLKNSNIKFVSIEPLHEKIDFWFSKKGIDWLIVGAETGNRKEKIKPEMEWVTSIIENARAEGIPLFLKGNLHWSDTTQEYPGTSKKYLKNTGSPKDSCGHEFQNGTQQ